MRQDYKAWKVQRPEPSCKPKSEDQPFEKQRQYQKDFRPWPIPKRGDHPWIPKPMATPAVDPEKGGKKEELGKEKKASDGPGEGGSIQGRRQLNAPSRKKKNRRRPRRGSISAKSELQQPQPGSSATQEGSKGRVAVDALNWQIKEEGTARVTTSSYRNEFRPWTNIRPGKAIKAKPQYKPPGEKIVHQISHSSQFTAESAKAGPTGNKRLEPLRTRSLCNELLKESPKSCHLQPGALQRYWDGQSQDFPHRNAILNKDGKGTPVRPPALQPRDQVP